MPVEKGGGKSQNDEQSALLQKAASSQLIKQQGHSIRQLCTEY